MISLYIQGFNKLFLPTKIGCNLTDRVKRNCLTSQHHKIYLIFYLTYTQDHMFCIFTTLYVRTYISVLMLDYVVILWDFIILIVTIRIVVLRKLFKRNCSISILVHVSIRLIFVILSKFGGLRGNCLNCRG